MAVSSPTKYNPWTKDLESYNNFALMSAKYKIFIVLNNFKQFRTITNSNKPKGF